MKKAPPRSKNIAPPQNDERTGLGKALSLYSAYGWRGRIAVRWTLTGFLMLVLAYVGSKFVLEVVLGRT